MDHQTVTMVKEETEAADRWHSWCRLCAKEDKQGNINICSTEDQRNLSLLAAVGLYFSVNIVDDDMLPKMLCVECRTLLTSMVIFHEHVKNVQQMFSTLQFVKEGEHFDLHTVRLKCGLLPEIYYCDTKPNINEINIKAVLEERSDNLNQANVYLKTEHDDDDVSINGTISLERGCSDDVESTAIANNHIECFDEILSESDSDLDVEMRVTFPSITYLRPFRLAAKLIREMEVPNVSTSEPAAQPAVTPSLSESHSALVGYKKIRLSNPRTPLAPLNPAENRLLNQNVVFVSCKVCGKIFSCRSHLIQHTRVHSKQKPFMCDLCGTGFTQSRNLYRHVRNLHRANQL